MLAQEPLYWHTPLGSLVRRRPLARVWTIDRAVCLDVSELSLAEKNHPCSREKGHCVVFHALSESTSACRQPVQDKGREIGGWGERESGSEDSCVKATWPQGHNKERHWDDIFRLKLDNRSPK